MRRWLALAVVGLMLAVPAASAASWERSGYDPGRTGAIPFEGPQSNDTAFQAELPGTPFRSPVVTADAAYVATLDFGFEGLGEEAVWRIDLTTGRTERLFNLSEEATPLVVTEDLLISSVFHREDTTVRSEATFELVAREIPTGRERWRAEAMPDRPVGQLYHRAVTSEGVLYAGFLGYSQAATSDVQGNVFAAELPVSPGVAAVDMETGEVQWTWLRQMREMTVRGQEVPDPAAGPERNEVISGMAADDERVYVYMRLRSQANGATRSQFELRALAAENGASLWARNDTAQTTPLAGFGRLTGAAPVATSTAVHIRLDAFQALNPATGQSIWTSPAGRSDHIEIQGSSAMGTTGEALIATSPESVYRLDPRTGELDWQKTDVGEDKVYNLMPMAIHGDTVYVPTIHDTCAREGQGLEARDLETGDLRWRWNRTPTVGNDDCGVNLPSFVGVGPGVMVDPAKDGIVTVVGETEASLGEPDVDSAKYPDEGEQVAIDAAGAEPGAMGPATRYMVDWGDGSISGWQESPTFTHTYNESGEYQAQVYAGNDANQTASTVATMNVGGSEPNLAETAFARENQDLTFGLLGLAVALGGGAIGATKRYRKRSRLEEELETLETGYEDSRDRPGECEAFLETRRARARSLVLDGVLTEEQGTIVQDRADELRRELRTQALEDEFGFLPYSLVTKARQMLEDGRVTALEVEAFESALDEVEGLSEEQRTVVRERIESWEARDEGGA